MKKIKAHITAVHGFVPEKKLTNQDLDKLYNREMKRARMFASDAINKEECEKILSRV